jgi:flavin reductase (DIM6/NTAB) family NADH-FMN oxidoreductase RutF
MGRFATGVTVVTTVTQDGVHGMTASGFMSVSLEPPLVLVSLGRCKMADLLRVSDRYAVNVLGEEQESISCHFAGQSRLHGDIEFEWNAGLPYLPDALAHIGCRIVDRHPAGDHTLFIGEVERLEHRNGTPLLFYTGDYRSLHVGTPHEVFFY